MVGEVPQTDSVYVAKDALGKPVENIADILRAAAVRYPEHVAVDEAGVRSTFHRLDTRSNAVAQGVVDGGGVPGDRVLYIGKNSTTFLEVLYGTNKAGLIFAAINPRLSKQEITSILKDLEPSFIIGDGEALKLCDVELMTFSPHIMTVDGVQDSASYQSWLERQRNDDPMVDTKADDTCVILYTSGTTGLPKGVMLTGRNFGSALYTLHTDIELDPTSVANAPIPFFHIAGLGLSLASILNGAELLLQEASTPEEVLNLITSKRVSHAAVVPTVLQRILNLEASKSADFSALKYIVYGASPIPVPVLKSATEIIGCKFIQSYGLTESTGGATLLAPSDHIPDQAYEERLRSAGKMMPGGQIKIVDPQSLEEVEAGVHGEVWISGDRIMKGYWAKPSETQATITSDGWLRTGDGGSFDQDGYLYLHDRIKDMVVSGGENIYPAEVESILTAHPDIAEVAVIGLPSTKWGESVYAVVVPKANHSPDPDSIITWARDNLAHFKCPVGVAFTDALPRTASGKLQKARLREIYKETQLP